MSYRVDKIYSSHILILNYLKHSVFWIHFFLREFNLMGVQSSIGLGFFNPTFRLRRWDVMSFCMQ